MTSVIHIKNAPPGWKMDDQYVYIGRGSVWGNPFAIGKKDPLTALTMDREKVCNLYEEVTLPSLRKVVHQLKGKTLVCFCHPERCHGHALAIAAEEV